MSELRFAKASMNADVTAQLESRDIFDPASLDCQLPDPTCTVGGMLVDEALELGDGGRLSNAAHVGGYGRVWMPWEIIL